uniref:Uncharacterized protein n=1 Tax=Anguilla anguilla TaxID=7936 RepID=A0A0E9WDK6_ANGAN
MTTGVISISIPATASCFSSHPLQCQVDLLLGLLVIIEVEGSHNIIRSSFSIFSVHVRECETVCVCV